MKKTNKTAFLALFGLIACLTLPLQAVNKNNGKKKGKNDDFEQILLKNSQIIAQNQKRNENEKTTILEKQKLEEKKRSETEQKLCGDYKFFSEFKRSVKNWNPCDNTILQQYSTWLETIKSILIIQDSALDSVLEYATHFSKSPSIRDHFQKALGSCVKFNSQGTGYFLQFKIDAETNNYYDIVFGLRYKDLLESGSKNWSLSAETKNFLQSYILLEQNERFQWWAHAILATNQFMCHEQQGEVLGKKHTKCLHRTQSLIHSKSNEINLSSSMRLMLFEHFGKMIDVKNHNFLQQQKGIDTDHEMYVAIQDLYTKAQENKKRLFQLCDDELEKIQLSTTKKPLRPTNTEATTLSVNNDPVSLQTTLEKNTSKVEEIKIEQPPITHQHSAKMDDQTKSKPISYAKATPTKSISFYNEVLSRVTRWYNDPEGAFKHLQDTQLNNQKYVSNNFAQSIIKAHTYSDAVDYFVEPLAIKCSWQAQGAQEGSLSYNIPGQIIDHDTNTTTTGVFSYGVNKNGSLFHRCFSKRAYEKISDDIKKQIYDGQYPDLTDEQTLKKQTQLRVVKGIKDYSGFIKENNFYIEIEDKDNNMTIKLFKVKK